jgi:hypothetical protein
MHEESTKRCAYCKEKKREYRQKNIEKAREKDKLYHQKHKKERNAKKNAEYAENPERQKARSKARYAANPEEMRSQKNAQSNMREGKLKKIKKNAKDRGLDVKMSDDEIMNMTDMQCVYCGKETEDAVRRNGIDRLDSSIGYIFDNCVPCCGVCNLSKGQVDPLTFVERARQISLHHGGSGEITDHWSQINKQRFGDYKYIVIKSNKIFDLTEEEFEELRSRDCEYCGRSSTTTHSNGIDCVDCDPNIGYVSTNCVPACRDCNFMKNTTTYEDFIVLMKKIAMCEHAFGDVPRVLTTFMPKKKNM